MKVRWSCQRGSGINPASFDDGAGDMLKSPIPIEGPRAVTASPDVSQVEGELDRGNAKRRRVVFILNQFYDRVDKNSIEEQMTKTVVDTPRVHLTGSGDYHRHDLGESRAAMRQT
jgi:hypothetical protein